MTLRLRAAAPSPCSPQRIRSNACPPVAHGCAHTGVGCARAGVGCARAGVVLCKRAKSLSEISWNWPSGGVARASGPCEPECPAAWAAFVRCSHSRNERQSASARGDGARPHGRHPSVACSTSYSQRAHRSAGGGRESRPRQRPARALVRTFRPCGRASARCARPQNTRLPPTRTGTPHFASFHTRAAVGDPTSAAPR